MNADRLLQQYERIADAPDAVPRLRHFILDLAVRGKLVPQDPAEEPAKGFRKPTDPAAPFGLPSNWKWIEIGDQLDLLNGMAFKPTDWTRDGLRIVRIQNLNNPEARAFAYRQRLVPHKLVGNARNIVRCLYLGSRASRSEPAHLSVRRRRLSRHSCAWRSMADWMK